jgi:hypothetical protein
VYLRALGYCRLSCRAQDRGEGVEHHGGVVERDCDHLDADHMFGPVVEFYLATPQPEYVATWGEFKRSGWTDVHAIPIANTLDSAQSHLIIGPIAGAIFGAIGGVITRLNDKQEQRPAIV